MFFVYMTHHKTKKKKNLCYHRIEKLLQSMFYIVFYSLYQWLHIYAIYCIQFPFPLYIRFVYSMNTFVTFVGHVEDRLPEFRSKRKTETMFDFKIVFHQFLCSWYAILLNYLLSMCNFTIHFVRLYSTRICLSPPNTHTWNWHFHVFS